MNSPSIPGVLKNMSFPTEQVTHNTVLVLTTSCHMTWFQSSTERRFRLDFSGWMMCTPQGYFLER